MIVPTALLMLEAPLEGAVKARLGGDIGPAGATRAHRALVEHQLREIPSQWRVHICYAPEGALAAMRAWLGDGREYSAEADGDLILGGDCPYLSGERLIEAAVVLEQSDAVVVPAVDGGYSLIALRRAEPNVVRAISWSTDAVLAQTRQRLREHGLTWTELEAAEDMDDGASWQRARQAFPQLDVSAP